MRHPIKIVLFLSFIIPSHLASGQRSPCTNATLTDTFYLIINLVIKEYNLDTTAKLYVKAQELSPFESDKKYLKTLLKDSSRKFTNIIPDKNLLDPADIQYMNCIKENYKDFKWNSKNVNLRNINPDLYYYFSLPYFNSSHDLIIVSFSSYHLDGKWSQGKILVLKKTDGKWLFESLETWVT